MPNNTLYQQGYGRIKPRPMTPVNFASPLGADLLYCWPFGDPWSPREVVNGGSTVKWGGPYLVPGQFQAPAISFNGTSDSLSTSPSVNLTDVLQFTLSFWLYTTVRNSADNLVFEFGDGATADWGFHLDVTPTPVSSFAFRVNGNAGRCDWNSIGGLPSDNVWHHWAIRIDLTKSSNEVDAIFIDGVATSPTTINPNVDSSSLAASDLTMWFMSRTASSLFVGGALEDFRIYSRLLTLEDVRRYLIAPFAPFSQPAPIRGAAFSTPAVAGAFQAAWVRPGVIIGGGIY